ncbi:MAG: flagellar hook-length control protein FliK, partial [Desulfobulbus sp.]|nr:flagellar hook-length control protein FliK [Desulfobulbus sp.]
AASQPPAVSPQDAFSRAASPTSESAINHLDQKNPPSAGGQRLDPMGPDIHFSRIITVQQQAAPAESDLPEVVAVNTAPALSGQQVRQDVADLAIRSHLPSDAPASVRGNGGPHQEASGSKEHNRPADTGSRQAESLQARQPMVVSGQDGPPLLFALQQEVAASPASSTAGVESAGVRLPSGLIVPDSAAMDQLLTHLSQQSKLATTTIQLRLNPQELGELRMEIKVKQDNITAHIIAQNPQAQEMIDRHLPRLREALEQQGLHLQQVEVTLAASDNTDSQRFHDNPNRQLAPPAPEVRTPPSAFVPSGAETAQPTAPPAHGLNVVA